MKKFEIQLAEKQRRNRAHLENLERFIGSERFEMLPEEQKALMTEQYKAQAWLDRILIRRMELLGLPVCR